MRVFLVLLLFSLSGRGLAQGGCAGCDKFQTGGGGASGCLAVVYTFKGNVAGACKPAPCQPDTNCKFSYDLHVMLTQPCAATSVVVICPLGPAGPIEPCATNESQVVTNMQSIVRDFNVVCGWLWAQHIRDFLGGIVGGVEMRCEPCVAGAGGGG